MNVTTDHPRPLTASAVFPLLAALPSSGHLRTVAIGSDPVQSIGRDPDAFRRSLVSSLLEVGQNLPLLALTPALAAVLSEPLPLDRFGVRAANLIRRADLLRWRDLVPLSPTDLLALSGFGETSLRAVVEVSVERSIEVVLAVQHDGRDDSADETDSVLPVSGRLQGRTDHAERLGEGRGSTTLGDLFPNLRVDLDEELPPGLLPTRLANRAICETWRELLEIQLDALYGLTNVGNRSVGVLLDRLGDLQGDTAKQSEDPPPFDEASDSLRLLAAWAKQDRDVTCLGDLIQLRTDLEALPPELAREWHQFQEQKVPDPCSSETIGNRIVRLLDELSERDRVLLGRRVWPASSSWTLEQVGNEVGLTRERVRQIEGMVVSSFRHRITSDEYRYVSFRAAELRRRLGSVAPMADKRTEKTVKWATRDVPTSKRQLAFDLLLWLAGPYTMSDGWWRHAADAPQMNGNDLRDRASESGFISDDSVASLLEEFGVRDCYRAEWIGAFAGFRRVEGGWLDSAGSIIDQSLRYLAYRGVPMPVEEILEGIGRTEASTRSVRHRLFEDSRAMRVSKSEIGLTEWGHNEYTSLADEMLEELEREGGRMPLDRMIERLVEQFGVSPNSVRMYAGRPLFLLDADGWIQVRPADKPYEVRDDLLRVPSCYELSVSEASWRVEVDRDVLRGSGRHIPEQLAGWLRLRPGQTLTLHNASRPLALAWRSWAQPDVGSLKPFADEPSASEGDWLLLVMGRAGAVDVRLVERSAAAVPGLALLLQLVGLPGELGEDPKEAMRVLGQILGVETSDEDSLRFRIRASLQARRDLDILDVADAVLLG